MIKNKIKINFFTRLKNEQTCFIIKQILNSNSNFVVDEDKFELLIVVGGDGTILDALKQYYDKNIKIIVFNSGRVGFLSSNFTEKYKIDIESNNFEPFSYLELCTKTKTLPIINEILLVSEHNPIKIKVLINNNEFYDYYGSGFLTCTSNGSTGLNRSLNNPILLPNNTFLFSEYLPVKTSNNIFLGQPLILNDKYILDIELEYQETNNIFIKIDGQNQINNISNIRLKLNYSIAKIYSMNDAIKLSNIKNKLIRN